MIALRQFLLPWLALRTVAMACDIADSTCFPEEDEDLRASSLHLLQTGHSVESVAQPSPLEKLKAAGSEKLKAARSDLADKVKDKIDGLTEDVRPSVSKAYKEYIDEDVQPKGRSFDDQEQGSGAPSPNSLAICLFGLLGTLVMSATILSCSQGTTKRAMWCILHKTIAAFGAAILVACFRDITNFFLPSSIAVNYYLLGPFMRLLLGLFVFKAVIHLLADHDNLIIASTLGKFFLGFVAIDAFDGLMRLDGTETAGINFAQSPGSASVAAMCSIVLMLGFIYMFTITRNNSPEVEVDAMRVEQHVELEDDAFAIATGFLICQVATFALMAQIFPVGGMPVLKDRSAIPYTAFAAVTAIFGAWLAVACMIWSFKRLKVAAQVNRIEHFIVRTTSLSLAWCCLRWGQLVLFSNLAQVVGEDDPMLGRLLNALVNSVGILLYAVIVTNMLRGSKSTEEGGTPDFYALATALGLIIGQSWMSCFYRASAGFGIPTSAPEGVSRLLLLQQDPGQGAGAGGLLQVVLFLALFTLLLPVWKLCALPNIPRKSYASDVTGTPQGVVR